MKVPTAASPIGYARVIQEYGLRVLPPPTLSYVSSRGGKQVLREGSQTLAVYPNAYAPGDTLCEQLEFALKHEGVQLGILDALFHSMDVSALETQLVQAVRERPTGLYSRKLWFLYEYLTDRRLPLPDAEHGVYTPVLDPKKYYTAEPQRSRRHRVLDNLLGPVAFCPIVRRTESLRRAEAQGLAAEATRLVASYDEDAIRRAVSYLYTKETRSSFAIEGEKPSHDRAERFVALLRLAPELERFDEATFVGLQSRTVDPRFAEPTYRTEQNYVGETVGLVEQHVHYIPPKPGDVRTLMQGLLECRERMAASRIDPVVQAAVFAFGFVFVHPFMDGNGRLHRLLIHHVLSRAGFTPRNLIFPISAVMLQRRAEYDATLESFSRPLMELLRWEHDDEWKVTVSGETASHYRFIDFTQMAEALYGWVEHTLRTELRRELEFVVRFREAREEMERVVDLPGRELNLFVQLVLQNKGRLSAAKRASQFRKLTDDEVDALETIIRERLLPVAPR
ncbi:MAG: Fic family protein [Myxococcaceae bacterium]|nr:Fic family protein [Myxococcaceae bacterium]MCI0673467.1 Fic family protein [Myxococcaceae bacterium]